MVLIVNTKEYYINSIYEAGLTGGLTEQETPAMDYLKGIGYSEEQLVNLFLNGMIDAENETPEYHNNGMKLVPVNKPVIDEYEGLAIDEETGLPIK